MVLVLPSALLFALARALNPVFVFVYLRFLYSAVDSPMLLMYVNPCSISSMASFSVCATLHVHSPESSW